MTHYLPADVLSQCKLGTLAPGVVAYSPDEKSWLFTVATPEDERYWVALTGEDAFSVHVYPANDPRVVQVVEGWRVELVPSSAVNGHNKRLFEAQTFRTADAAGFGVKSGQARHYEAATPIGFDGAPKQWPNGTPATYFGKWRIVAGSADKPFVICEVDTPGWGS